jgi:hypothetical protein
MQEYSGISPFHQIHGTNANAANERIRRIIFTQQENLSAIISCTDYG